MISLPTVGLAIAFAFAKVYDKPFADFLLVMARFMFTARKRVWKRAPGVLSNAATGDQQVTEKHKEEKTILREKIEKKHLNFERIDDLASILDTVGGLEEK